MTTQRRAVRAPVRLPVSIHRRQPAQTADVSAAGFALETTGPLPRGLPVHGLVFHGSQELPWSGVVAWSTAGSPMTSLAHRVGVRFTSVSVGLRALLSIRSRQHTPRSGTPK